MNNLARRLATAAVAIPVIVLISMAGGIYFFLFVSAASAVALHEFYRLAEMKGARPRRALGIAAGFVMNITFFYPRLSAFLLGLFHDLGLRVPFPSQTQLTLIAALLILLVLAVKEIFNRDGNALVNIASTAFGIFYVSLFFSTFIGLREVFTGGGFPLYRYLPGVAGSAADAAWAMVYRWGGYTVVSILAIIWICDTAAYHAGVTMGKHKLSPVISPNKTWEGAVAGFIFAIISALAAKYLVLEYLGVGDAIVLGVIVGIFGQVGDLFESSLKRDAGVKDSSALLPGHGGVLDRFDSLLFVSPLAYIYIDYILLS